MRAACAARFTAAAAISTALIVAAARAPAASPASATPASHTVTISGTTFKPAALAVKVGDRIVWKNDDPFAHTVTARDGRFDSKEIAAGGSWTYVAGRAGTFAYFCTFHRTMTGTLTVR